MTKYEYFPGMNLEERILFDILREIEIITSGGVIIDWTGGFPTYDLRYALIGGAIHGPVTNFSALPAVGTVSGQYWEVLNSQGTQWLPGALGGTYYPNGIYYSDGINWHYSANPNQATQSDVNAGIITDQFVSPFTLKNSPLSVPVGTLGSVAFWGASGLTQDNTNFFWDNIAKTLKLKQPTLGNSIQTFTTATSGTSPVINILQDRVTTVNATVSTLHTFTTTTDLNSTIFVEVSARRTGGTSGATGDSGLMSGKIKVKNVGGVLTILNSTTDNVGADQGWIISWIISGINILLQVTGSLNNNVTWTLMEARILTAGS